VQARHAIFARRRNFSAKRQKNLDYFEVAAMASVVQGSEVVDLLRVDQLFLPFMNDF